MNQFIFTTLSGMGFGLIYRFYGLFAAIMAHTLGDFLGFLLFM